MKRVIEEKKKNLQPAPKKTVAAATTAPQKTLAIAAGKKAAEIKLPKKKIEAKPLSRKLRKDMAISAQIAKPAPKKNFAPAKSQIEKPAAKKLKNKPEATKTALKTASRINAKTKSAIAEPKSAGAKTRKNTIAAVENKKPKTNQKASAEKTLAKAAAGKTERPQAKKIASAAPVKKPETPGKSAKTEVKNKSAAAVKNVRQKVEKKAAAVVSKIEKTPTQKVKTPAPIEKSKPQTKIVKAKVAEKTVKTVKTVAQIEKIQRKAPVLAPKIGSPAKIEQTKVAATAKNVTTAASKAKIVSIQKPDTKPKAKISVKDVKLPKAKAENFAKKPLEIKASPIEIIQPKKKVVNKKAKAIGSAVFRGKKESYDFQIFALDEKFEHIKAVYIISKRMTDRKKRGHHKLVYIGQTESIIEGIKEHKKDKCIKHNQANVICLLKEEDEKSRLRIAADLREAHAIACKKE